jgi:hypothetical protein
MALDVDAVDYDGGDLVCSVDVIVVVVILEVAFDSISINMALSGHFKAPQHSNASHLPAPADRIDPARCHGPPAQWL